MVKVILDSRERPAQAVGEFESAEDWSDLLPSLAKLAGYELRAVEFLLDPFVLYDRWGYILHEWPCGYIPHWTEVNEVCNRFL